MRAMACDGIAFEASGVLEDRSKDHDHLYVQRWRGAFYLSGSRILRVSLFSVTFWKMLSRPFVYDDFEDACKN